MRAPSLRLRLLAGAALAISAALVVAWSAMTWMFGRHVERREAAELTRSGLVLAAGLAVGPGGALRVEPEPPDPRFASPAGGLYWQLSTPAVSLRSRSLWDQALARPARAPAADWRLRRGPGPFGADLLLAERLVQPDPSGPAVLIQVATDSRPLDEARREFGRELALFLCGLWAVLTAAAFIQVRLGLRPLARVGAEVQRMRRNPGARLPGGEPREVAPLVAAINDLADARQGDIERARRRAADLAHSLKTPLAALAAQSRRAREAGAEAAADGLDRAIAAVAAALEAELARARAAAMRESRPTSRTAAEIAERVIAVIERTEDGERVVIAQEIPADLQAPAPEDALTEILGALTENAARHARALVRLSGAREAAGVRLVVEDDGAGLPEGRLEAALMRGGRLDEAGPGHGLGLAIARDLVAATNGRLDLGRSELGGLRVSLAWPPVA